MTYQSVLVEIERWPIEERIRLIDDLNERLVDDGNERELSDELKAELDRRIEEMDRNPEAGIPWEIVKAEALSRLKK